MWKLAYLNWRDWAVVGVGVLLLAVLAQRDPGLVAYSGAAHVVHYSDGDIDARVLETEAAYANARDAYHSQFKTESYFGAFAIGRDGAYGWAGRHNSIRAARANALSHCAQYGPDCQIYAEIYPDGYDAAAGYPLRQRVQTQYLNYMQRPGPKAIAVAENGAAGYASGRWTIWGAKMAALLNCRARVRENQASYLPRWQCRVVQASWF